MNQKESDIIVSVEESIPTEWIEAFTRTVEEAGLGVSVERREGGPQAGMDWLVPTAVAIIVGGFLKAAGEDAYWSLKEGLRRLVEKLKNLPTQTIATAPGKISSEPPGQLTVALQDGSGGALRFVFPSDSQLQAAALEALNIVLDDSSHRAALLARFAQAQAAGFAAWKVIARYNVETKRWIVEAPLSGRSWPIE